MVTKRILSPTEADAVIKEWAKQKFALPTESKVTVNIILTEKGSGNPRDEKTTKVFAGIEITIEEPA